MFSKNKGADQLCGFAYADCWFSDAAAHFLYQNIDCIQSDCLIHFKLIEIYLSRLMGKPTICIGENKDADQLRGNREADQRLCFRYSDSTIPLLLKSEISSF